MVSLKRCTACGEEKAATTEFFHDRGKDGLRAQCRVCRKAKVDQYRFSPEGAAKRAAVAARAVETGRAAQRSREWQLANPERHKAARKAIRERKKEQRREYALKWRQENREKAREKQRRCDEKRSRDPAYVLKHRVKGRLRLMLKGNKSASTEQMLGYTATDLKAHIERQFTKGMSWDRLLAGDIHIDHIRPVASFSITTADDPDFKCCWALSNLRPMWAADNRKKSAQRVSLL